MVKVVGKNQKAFLNTKKKPGILKRGIKSLKKGFAEKTGIEKIVMEKKLKNENNQKFQLFYEGFNELLGGKLKVANTTRMLQDLRIT